MVGPPAGRFLASTRAAWVIPCHLCTTFPQASALRYITVMARHGTGPGSLPSIVSFFKSALGCDVVQLGEQWARIETGGTPIAVQVVDR